MSSVLRGDPQKAPNRTAWILGLGGVGFAAGFWGPLILTPEANQGPLLGILITGPLGLFTGAVLAACFRVFPSVPALWQWRLLQSLCALIVLASFVFIQPEAKAIGYEMQFEKWQCRPLDNLLGEALAEWDRRIQQVHWAKPWQGWRETLSDRVRQDPGCLFELDAETSSLQLIYEHRKTWNRGQRFYANPHPGHPAPRFYLSPELLRQLQDLRGKGQQTLWVDFREKVQAPDANNWPPQDVIRFLGLQILRQSPPL